MTGSLEALASYTMAVLSGLGDAVIAVDRDGAIVALNPLAEKLAGADARGRRIDDACPATRHGAPLSIAALAAEVARGGAVVALPSETRIADHAVAGTLLPLREAGRVRGVLFVFSVAL